MKRFARLWPPALIVSWILICHYLLPSVWGNVWLVILSGFVYVVVMLLVFRVLAAVVRRHPSGPEISDKPGISKEG